MEISQMKDNKRKVTFAVKAPFATEIILSGDFNHWHPSLHTMKRDDSGLWKLTVYLLPGKYEYKLQVDGRWWEDFSDGKTVRNTFGTLNKVIVVPGKGCS